MDLTAQHARPCWPRALHRVGGGGLIPGTQLPKAWDERQGPRTDQAVGPGSGQVSKG